jgi:anthranilate phosphoribosyltransferase
VHPRDYGFSNKDVPLESLEQLLQQIKAVVQGKPSDLRDGAILNGGFYLWRCGVCQDLETGFTLAESMLTQGKLAEKLEQLT